MKDLLPRPRELALFAALAVVSTAVVALIGKYDLGMAVMGGPIFLVASLMGLRRSGIGATPAVADAPTVDPVKTGEAAAS